MGWGRSSAFNTQFHRQVASTMPNPVISSPATR